MNFDKESESRNFFFFGGGGGGGGGGGEEGRGSERGDINIRAAIFFTQDTLS